MENKASWKFQKAKFFYLNFSVFFSIWTVFYEILENFKGLFFHSKRFFLVVEGKLKIQYIARTQQF